MGSKKRKKQRKITQQALLSYFSSGSKKAAALQPYFALPGWGGQGQSETLHKAGKENSPYPPAYQVFIVEQ